jgi:hypothetical protein
MSSLFNRGFGPNPSNEPFTLKMLEEQLAELREYGAPDDAQVIRGARGWAYFEIQWIDKPREGQ